MLFRSVKLIYLVFQYNINWIIYIWSIKLTPTIVIFDRYFDDILADPKRYRYGGKFSAVQIARLFVPRPAITFVLLAKPEIIYNRKKEVSMVELDSQLNRYNNLVEEYKYKKIEVSNTVSEIVNTVFDTSIFLYLYSSTKLLYRFNWESSSTIETSFFLL